MNFDKKYVAAFFLPITLLEPIDRLLLIAEPNRDQGTTKGPDHGLAELFRLVKQLQGFFTVAFQGVSIRGPQ